MALIGKIRKNFWFVLLLLGLALAAFVIMDMVNAGNRGGLGAQQVVGEVAGQKIDLVEFQKVEQTLFRGSSDAYAGKANAWNYLVEKSIVDDQSEDLGIEVSKDELMDLQFGNNLSPVIQSYFRNQQTGQIEMQQLLNIKQSIEGGEALNPEFENEWAQIQKNIIKTAKQQKITNLVSKAIYTPTFVAENRGKETTERVNFEYVKVPFDVIDDSEVEVTTEDIQEYINENKFQYTNEEETRILKYSIIDVLPSAEDSASIKAKLAELSNEFSNKAIGAEDSLYTITNDGFYSPYYAGTDELQGEVKDHVADMEVGDVYGPYRNQGFYILAKLVDKAIVPDSVEAKHILRSATEGVTSEFDAAEAYIDSLENVLRTTNADFSDLAQEHSEDPGSATKGGDLGTFVQGTMVPAFNQACFVGSEEGGLYKVKTRFGVHLIKVEDRIFNNQDPKYKLAYIRSVIVPSEKTINATFEKVDDIVSANRELPGLTTALENQGYSVSKTAPIKINDYLFADLGGGETSRDIIKWAYEEDTEINNVSPSIYEYTDPVNYYVNKYVLVGLGSVNPAGVANAEDMRGTLEPIVRNRKKGKQIVSQISGSDLEAVGSKYGSSIETADNVSFTASGITGLGNEPKVLSKAFALGEGQVSEPILGNSGVYVVKTTSKTDGSVPSNVIAQKKQINSSNRGRVSYSLMNALKKIFKPEDNRATYF